MQTASAGGCVPEPYAPDSCGRVALKVAVPKVVEQGKRPALSVAVVSRGGVKPQGTVTVAITGPKGFKTTKKHAYEGTALRLKGPKLRKKGTYRVTVIFVSDNFEDAKSTTSFKVKKKL
ncbi:hypothetical protein GCM10023349_37990 [Nocardioides conyzicola]|uniref:Ig-like domain repeat protein n=2 Tax=Nocardioides conyzicola TaxID=1651781 RepID=A0ABP8XWX1_9ACTN